MIKTLYQIGREISAGRDPWQDILAPPKLNPKDEEKSLYVLPIEFDLDTGDVIISKDQLEEYPKDSRRALKELRSLKIQGGNNKSIYVAVDAGKLEQLSKTLFGKADKKGQYPEQGEFLEAIDKFAPQVAGTTLYKVLEEITKCKDSFLELFQDEKGKLSISKAIEDFWIGRQQKIVMVYAVVSSQDFKLEGLPIGHLEGYESFIEQKFFSEKEASGKAKLCYATGELREDVKEAEFSGRYNINKFFVKTTQNYASGFNKKNYLRNYQLSNKVETYLDRGSDYLLENAVAEIAGIRHVIIPEFFQQERININNLQGISERAELLFKLKPWEEILSYLEWNTETEGLYWLTFLAIDSDGKYFKAGNQIKDVSKLHLQNVFGAVKEAGQLLRPWLGARYGFNLYSVYKSIPVRKDKENINVALQLFKALLEQRPVEKRLLFLHFKELILCHWYQRYPAYTNITPSDRDRFPFSVRDAVFRYLAFLHVLKRLGLIKSGNINSKNMEENKSIGQEIEAFLAAMEYDQQQQALFHLGQVLNRVVYEQTVKKGHKKNALDKLNYNGMDKQSIYRFANELFESSRHYDITRTVAWDWGRFSRSFKMEGWSMDPQEALFYILSGYAYSIKSNPSEEETNIDNQN